jgi:subtilase family serine protease
MAGVVLAGLLVLPAVAAAQDLVVKEFLVGVSGTEVTYRVQVCNNGAAISQGFDLELYHHLPRAPGCETLQDQAYRFTTGLAAGACVTHTFRQLGAGGKGHTAWAQVDADCEVPETDEGNNYRSQVYTINSTRPDFYVASFSAVASGSNVAFVTTVCNGGGSSSVPFDLELYHHLPGEPGCETAASQSRRITAGLAAGACVTRSFARRDAASGSYRAWVRVDADCEVLESNELNNAMARIYPVRAAKPDLYLSAFSVTVSGTSVSYDVTVCNGGAAVGAAFDLELYHHRHAAPGCSSPASQQVRFAAGLGAGACATRSFKRSGASPGSQLAWARVDADCKISESDEGNNQQAAIYQVGQPLPDLRVAHLSAQVSGATASYLATVCNYGGSTASASSLELYYKLKRPPGCGTLYSRHERLDGGLAAGACVTRSFSRGGLTAGNYTIWARADANCEVPESDETNNNASWEYAVGKADLVVSALAVSVAAGTTVTYDTRVCNIGQATSTAFELGLYYKSALAPVCITTTSQAASVAGGLASAACATRTFLRRDAIWGDFKGWARADARCTVIESKEKNNTRFQSYTVGATRPNLYLDEMVVTVGNGTVGYGVKFCNSGVPVKAPFELELYYHHSSAPGCTSVQSQTYRYQRQMHNACFTHTFYRYGVPAGVYRAWARVDADCQVLESNEYDNQMARPYVVGKVTRPELYVSKLDVAVDGSQVTYTATVCNAGTGAGPFDLGIYRQRSAEPTCTVAADHRQRFAAGLAAGQCATRTTVHKGAAAGSHVAWALADAGCVVTETLEDDNLASRAYRVAAPGPDLRVTQLHVSVRGSRLTCEVTACNHGAAASGAFSVGLFTHRNAAPRCSNTPDGRASFGALASGACDTRQLTLTAPGPGSWLAWALADAACAVTEADEQNNTLSRSYGVAPATADAGATEDAELPSDGSPPDTTPPGPDAERNEEDAGTTVDGGFAEEDTSAARDRGTPGTDGGSDGGGCNCRLAPRPPSGSLGLLLALMVLVRRRF